MVEAEADGVLVDSLLYVLSDGIGEAAEVEVLRLILFGLLDAEVDVLPRLLPVLQVKAEDGPVEQ